MRNGFTVRSLFPLILFAAAIVLPLLAIKELSATIDPLYLLGFVGTLSIFTGWMYAWDKRRAVRQDRRVPETTLHLLELSGGWACAFWAQRVLRHKIRKVAYQVVFWLICALHQLVAFDYLMEWTYFRRVFWFLGP